MSKPVAQDNSTEHFFTDHSFCLPGPVRIAQLRCPSMAGIHCAKFMLVNKRLNAARVPALLIGKQSPLYGGIISLGNNGGLKIKKTIHGDVKVLLR